MSVAPDSQKAGLYVAHHRWLDADYGPGNLHKVGHTGNLSARLNDSAYVTCFPEPWQYVATFELSSKEEAFLLETAVLHCCRHYRLGTRELVRMRAPDLIQLAEKAAKQLGLTPVRRDSPVYASANRRGHPAEGSKPGAEPAEPSEPTAWAAKRRLIESLTVPGSPSSSRLPSVSKSISDLAAAMSTLSLGGGPGSPPHPSPPQVDLSDTVDDILSWDFSGVKTPVAERAAKLAAPPPRPSSAPLLREAARRPAAPEPPQDDMLLDEVDDRSLTDTADAMELDGDLTRSTRELIGGFVMVSPGSPFDIGGLARSFVGGPALALRDYQREAAAGCLSELKLTGKAILQMACRCGKTPVAYEIIREYLGVGRTGPADELPVCALYLVPGLSLLRQTAQKIASYGFAEPILLVGSDPRPVALPAPPAGTAGAAPAASRELTMTTDPAVVRAFVAERGRRLVISTYQSSPQLPTDVFTLTIFDEAHRVSGGKAPRPFNHFILAPRVGARLFMTATPAYDLPVKTSISMRDASLFGGVAFRYHLRQGISAGHVNDFRLEVVAAPSARAATASVEEAAAPSQILAAMARVDKLLVFCRDIAHTTRLRQAVAEAPLPPGVAPFECLEAHSKQGPGGAAGALRKFGAAGVRAALFNCRLFQEGVEIPPLNGVFFAAPRHSPRDIVQSLCRPLNRTPGKPPSVIFLPVLHDPAKDASDPANLKRYASIVPFVDALLDEDPRLYEHLLDPAASAYPIDILGTHTLKLADAKSRSSLLASVRRAARYGVSAASKRPAERLLRSENLPWDKAFGELRRIVETCNRYVKTTDAWHVGDTRIPLYRFYRWAADEYAEWRAGRPTKLEPHQINDLRTLSHWELYGVEGPYPWRLCMEFLEQYLSEHGGEPPMLELHRGGYVGLDASAMERLSGALTCVNQGDGRARKGRPPGSGFTISAERQADMDRICGKFRLRWRKERNSDGSLSKTSPKTWLQESYARFQSYYKAHGSDGEYIKQWFTGYPSKHMRQESLEVQEKGLAPPRWKTKKRRPRADGEDSQGSTISSDPSSDEIDDD
jgi:superfamily II DNA or RNA helicase